MAMGAEHQRPSRSSSGKNKHSSSGGAAAQGQGLGVINHGLAIAPPPHTLLMPPMVEMMQGIEPLAVGSKGPVVDVKDLLRHGMGRGYLFDYCICPIASNH